MALVQSDDSVASMRIDKNHGCILFGFRQAVDSVDLKAQYISAASIPRDCLALADIAKEMMFRAKGELFSGECEIC